MTALTPRAKVCETIEGGFVLRMRTAADVRRLGTGLAFAAAGTLIFLGFATTPWEGSRDTASYLASLRESPAQAQLSAALLHFGYLLAVPALIGLLPRVRGRGVALVHAGALLLALGFATFSGLVASDFWSLSMAQNLPSEAAASAFDGVDRLGGLTAVAVPGFFGLLAGTALLALGLWRSRFAARPVAVCLVAAVAIMTIAGPSLLLNVVGSGLLLVAFGYLGWRVADPRSSSTMPAAPARPALAANTTAIEAKGARG